MGFIVKNFRELTTTTTTLPPTTTTTTLPADPTFPISDSAIFAGGFGGVGLDEYSLTVPVFNEFSKAIGGGTIGDVEITIPTNNSTYTETVIGSDFIDLDIKVVFTNTSGAYPITVELPRVAIDLPYQTSTVTDNFTPSDASTSVSLYTDRRLVVEFDKITITAGGSIERFVTGIVEVGTGSPNIDNVLNFGTVVADSITEEIEIELIRDTSNNGNVVVKLANVLNDSVEVTSFESVIAPFNTSGTYTFTPSTYYTNTAFGSVLRVRDTPGGGVPTYLLDHANKIGYVDTTTPAAITTTTLPPDLTTTTTTTQQPFAEMEFILNNFPSTTPQPGSVEHGDFFTFTVTPTQSNFGSVPFRIIVDSFSGTDVGLENVTQQSALSQSQYITGDVVDEGTLPVNNINGLTGQGIMGTFFNSTQFPIDLRIQLYIDRNNTGLYYLEDELMYNVNGQTI